MPPRLVLPALLTLAVLPTPAVAADHSDPCGVRAKEAEVKGRQLEVTLTRRGPGARAYEGAVTVRLARAPKLPRGSRPPASKRRGAVLARGSFSLAERAARGDVSLPLTRAGRAALRGHRFVWGKAKVSTRGARCGPVTTNLVFGR